MRSLPLAKTSVYFLLVMAEGAQRKAAKGANDDMERAKVCHKNWNPAKELVSLEVLAIPK